MGIRIWSVALAAAVLATAGVAVQANEIDLSKGGTLQEQQARIEKEFAAEGRYAEIEAEQQRRARDLMRRMEQLVDVDGRATTVSQDKRVALFNLQEELNGILEQAAEDSRLICRRQRHVGSNRPVNTCATVAERRRLREGGQEMLRSIRPSEGPPNQTF